MGDWNDEASEYNETSAVANGFIQILTRTASDGCYYPCLAAPEERHIGVWGRQHEQYLREYRPTIYHSLLLSDKLNAYLANIDQQAQEQYEQLIEQMKRAHGITEELKAADPMAWVGRMNTVQVRAKEIVSVEIIFA